VGLLGISELTSSSSWGKFAEDAILECDSVVSEITSKSNNRKPKQVLDLFDKLSTTLCKVTDSALLCANHPDRRHVENAYKASEVMEDYIGRLNTNQNLYKALLAAQKDSRFVDLTNGHKRFAAQMVHDFEQAGIHLNSSKRDQALQKKCRG
jgi:Zn-dependent oligopeptidase